MYFVRLLALSKFSLFSSDEFSSDRRKFLVNEENIVLRSEYNSDFVQEIVKTSRKLSKSVTVFVLLFLLLLLLLLFVVCLLVWSVVLFGFVDFFFFFSQGSLFAFAFFFFVCSFLLVICFLVCFFLIPQFISFYLFLGSSLILLYSLWTFASMLGRSLPQKYEYHQQKLFWVLSKQLFRSFELHLFFQCSLQHILFRFLYNFNLTTLWISLGMFSYLFKVVWCSLIKWF